MCADRPRHLGKGGWSRPPLHPLAQQASHHENDKRGNRKEAGSTMARSGSNKRKRKKQESFRLSDDEQLKLHALAVQAGTSKAAYIRQCCLDKEPARAQRNVTPNENFIAQMLIHLTAAAQYNHAGQQQDVQREHMMIRHLLCRAAGGQP